MSPWPAPSLLTLGTAALGMVYGVSNPASEPSDLAVENVLDRAWQAGISALDTAPAYGEAEVRVGHWLTRRRIYPHVATKLPGLGPIADGDIARAVDNAVRMSTTRLGIRPATYLTHDAPDYLRPAVRERLNTAAVRGEIGLVGMSAYTDAEVFSALAAGPPRAIQLPISAFDQRMVTSGALAACAAAGVTVFARSVFLQGVLLMAPDQLPPDLQILRLPLTELDRVCAEASTSRVSLALRFVRDLPGVSSTVIGAYSVDQLEASISAAADRPLSAAQREAITAIATCLPVEAIDPRRWPKRP